MLHTHACACAWTTVPCQGQGSAQFGALTFVKQARLWGSNMHKDCLIWVHPKWTFGVEYLPQVQTKVCNYKWFIKKCSVLSHSYRNRIVKSASWFMCCTLKTHIFYCSGIKLTLLLKHGWQSLLMDGGVPCASKQSFLYFHSVKWLPGICKGTENQHYGLQLKATFIWLNTSSYYWPHLIKPQPPTSI